MITAVTTALGALLLLIGLLLMLGALAGAVQL